MKGHKISGQWGIALLLAGLVILYFAPLYQDQIDHYRYAFYGIPAAAILAAAILTDAGQNLKVSRPSLISGEISYSIYLSHPFIVGAIAIIFKKTGMAETISSDLLIVIFTATIIISSFIAGYICHYIVDVPASNWVRQMWQKKPFLKASKIC